MAMQSELNAITHNNTWDLVTLPPGKNLIGLKWLFKVKPVNDGKGIKHKASLVAKGYSHQPDIDFQETFALVACFETIRVLLGIAASMSWNIHQLDVKSAFLNGELMKKSM
ncbi:putative mitochondrial protein AtMg00820 [Bidens hawaiensis]|uniref:putative mitochondrial protein AtMg00820 n=1 Tax=Bidens hawaiensis TaxID=980011 RepID=UPI00404B95B9